MRFAEVLAVEYFLYFHSFASGIAEAITSFK